MTVDPVAGADGRKGASGTDGPARVNKEPAHPDIPSDDDRSMDRPGREPGELVIAMSPRQIIGGFALVAGLILVLRRRARRKREG